MVYVGLTKPTNKIVAAGEPLVEELKVETATTMYPGRLVTKGTNQDDMKVGTALLPVEGWLGYEQTQPAYRPADVDTIYAADDQAAVLYGGEMVVVGSLATPHIVTKGDLVANWASGQLVGPIGQVGYGGLALKIPFTKNTSETDTGIDLPANMMVQDAFIEVTTAASSSTIDVGLLSSESGGDADGFLDGVSCASVGMSYPDLNDTTEANLTLGVLLGDHIKSADATPEYSPIRKAHVCDGTATSVTYTTSNHTIVGNIWLVLSHPNFKVVGRAMESADASSAAIDVMVKSLI